MTVSTTERSRERRRMRLGRAIALHRQGLPSSVIAERLGVNTWTVKDLLKSVGLKGHGTRGGDL